MQGVIRKWGKSPALRISAVVMKMASFEVGQRVTIKASKGRILIVPVDKPAFKIEALVAGITRRNAHRDVDLGWPVGKEVL